MQCRVSDTVMKCVNSNAGEAPTSIVLTDKSDPIRRQTEKLNVFGLFMRRS